jgi:hypothetical protein
MPRRVPLYPHSQAHAVKIDFASTILTTPRFKAGITPEVALFLANMLGELLANEKHSSYIVTLLRNLNVLVLMFKYLSPHAGMNSSRSRTSTP